jgi:hypothetical protein
MVVGVVLLSVGMAAGAGLYSLASRAPSWPYPPKVCLYVRRIGDDIARCRQDYAAGRLDPPEPSNARENTRRETRMADLLVTVRDRLPYVIQKETPDIRIEYKALAQARAAGQFVETQLLPAYERAEKTGKVEDIRSLVPLIDQLDKQLDDVLTTLKPYDVPESEFPRCR